MVWIFIDKTAYFLVQNPKTKKYLSSFHGSHWEVDDSAKSDWIKWDIIHFEISNKRYVTLKSLASNQYLTAKNYKKYGRGQPNDEGFHMTTSIAYNFNLYRLHFPKG